MWVGGRMIRSVVKIKIDRRSMEMEVSKKWKLGHCQNVQPKVGL